jgi:hypothetical protein
VRACPLSRLLGLPLRVHGIQLAVVVEALLDERDERVLGFEVACGDGAQRFLPFAVAELGADEVSVGSALTLIDEPDLDFYRRHSRRLADCGYVDPWVDDTGRVHEALSAA